MVFLKRLQAYWIADRIAIVSLTSFILQVGLAVFQRRHPHHILKMPVEVRQVIKTTVVAYAGHTHFIIDQQLAGIADPDL